MIETTRTEVAGHPVTVLRLAHGKASALDAELARALADAVGAEAPASGGTARALVLTGTRSIFSAGVDLKRLVDGGEAYLDAFLPALSAAIEALLVCDLPVVAAINGHAIAGGCILACACDRRLMADGRGTIGVPELFVGVPIPHLGLVALRLALPRGHLRNAVLTGRCYPADEALAMGLVDELVDPEELEATALAEAARLAAIPPAAFARTKRDLRGPYLARWRADRAALEAEMRAAWNDPSVTAALRAYVERTLGR